ncbi:MAG: 2-oxoacid:acceptor oxidoreductase subunit alpha [Alphaproteobacteria bacterium]|nr:2-oxoacid:acceptor oxidoreductase subunit alpha [Alphaproteobacteria bacterium]
MPTPKSRLNDFVLKIANVNGTGSASANGLLMKSLFRMGIPVVGKNFFPSNIQGMPTWYEIRITKKGYKARSGSVDIMVAMNAETYADDIKEVSPGGYLIYDSTWPRQKTLSRPDINIVGIPLAAMCNESFANPRVRILMKNMAYVGAVAALIDIDMAKIRELIEQIFAAKPDLVPANMKAIELGYDYAKANFDCPLPYRVKPMNKTKGHIMIDGNTAAGLGCVYAGATVGAWYPITPSTSLMDAFKAFCNRYRTDKKTGEKRFAIIQAEDELASAGMVIGASWTGARAFTCTSGPGISLMSELVGLAYYAEIPMVLFDIQRVGPSTGMPTRTQQSDLQLCAYASHGDTRHVLLFPADPGECFEQAVAAFDLAERLQTPVFVVSDLDIGMNDWMCKDLKWREGYKPDRGKVLSDDDLERIEKFYRYLDVDGDGIPYRTLPGSNPKGAYFTRGAGHNRYGARTEVGDEYQDVMDRLLVKWRTAADLVPPPVVRRAREKTKIGVLSVGSCDGAVLEALDNLARRGAALDYMRVRAFPFGDRVETFLAEHDRIFVVEQNRDAQLKAMLVSETAVDKDKLTSVLQYNGLPMDARVIERAIEDILAKEAAA